MTATLSVEQFNTFVRLVQAVELTQIRAQQAVAEAAAKRDRYYAEIAAQHHLPSTLVSLRWDDETLQIDVS